MRRRLVAVTGVMLAATIATAGGMRDLADAWLVPTWAVRSMFATDETAVAWSLTAAQGRLFALSELPQLGLTVGRRWRAASCTVRWERLGRTLYREDQWRLDVLGGHRWQVGVSAGADRLLLAGDAPRVASAVDLRVRGAVRPDLRLDVWWSLAAAPSWHGRQGLRRWLRLVGTGSGWAWAVVVDRRATGTPVFQGEIMLRLAPAAALGLRLEPWSGAAGFCTAWRLGEVTLRSSHLVHPELGASHRWSLGLGGAP